MHSSVLLDSGSEFMFSGVSRNASLKMKRIIIAQEPTKFHLPTEAIGLVTACLFTNLKKRFIPGFQIHLAIEIAFFTTFGLFRYDIDTLVEEIHHKS